MSNWRLELNDQNWERTLESEHFNTCTHAMDNVLLVKDAEGVAVFWDMTRKSMHYSIRVEDWYSCQTVGEKTYDDWVEHPDKEMAYLRERVRSLRSMQR